MNSAIVPTTVTGVAPFLVAVSAANSYDYEGTIGRSWQWGDGAPSSGFNNTLHTYIAPGVYFLSLRVTDADGNQNTRSQMITVNPSYASVMPEKTFDENNNNQEQKDNLASSCGSENGEACYYLGKIYQEEGNAFVYQELMQKACSLGYQQACGL